MKKGYIEGYYSRRLPIDAFKDLKTPISHYFYGPKEDIYLRHRWKELDKMGVVKRFPLVSSSNPANANPTGRIKAIEPGKAHGGKVCRGRKAQSSEEKRG